MWLLLIQLVVSLVQFNLTKVSVHKLSTTPPGDLDRSLFFVYNRFVAFEIRFYEPYEDQVCHCETHQF
jgi:hypothetical protein